MKDVLLFVYGTLKRGGSNHYYLDDSELLGESETIERYAMYVYGSIPFVVKDERRGPIKGELYKVNKEVLERVDGLEGHPFAYKRELVPVLLTNGNNGEVGKTYEAWMYFWDKSPIVKNGLLKVDGFYDVR